MNNFERQMQAYNDMGNHSGSTTRQGVYDTRDRMGSWEDFQFDDYTNPYAARQNEMLDRILNRQEFSYDRDEDPVWGSYKKSYLREGDRAQSNAIARASAMTGGRPSSFAVTAASQAGDYYASRLNDMIPQLYQQAYNKYLNEYQMKLQDLGAVNEQQQIDYRRFLDDRGFAFDAHNNAWNQLMQRHSMYRGLDESDWERARSSMEFDLQQAYNIFLATGQITTQELADALGLPMGTQTWDRSLAEQQLALAQARGGGGSRASGSQSLPDGTDYEFEEFMRNLFC